MELSTPRLVGLGDCAQATAFVNRVYDLAERSFWKDGWRRIDQDEMQRIIASGQLFALFDGPDIIGCVRLEPAGVDMQEFGMLCADPEKRNEGIGARLVAFAEQRAAELGAKRMQLHLLQGLHDADAGKHRVGQWYQRLGYQTTGSIAPAELDPALGALLRIPAAFGVFHKTL